MVIAQKKFKINCLQKYQIFVKIMRIHLRVKLKIKRSIKALLVKNSSQMLKWKYLRVNFNDIFMKIFDVFIKYLRTYLLLQI